MKSKQLNMLSRCPQTISALVAITRFPADGTASRTYLKPQSSSLVSQVFEAYGQTECTAGCTITSPGDWTAGGFSSCWLGEGF